MLVSSKIHTSESNRVKGKSGEGVRVTVSHHPDRLLWVPYHSSFGYINVADLRTGWEEG